MYAWVKTFYHSHVSLILVNKFFSRLQVVRSIVYFSFLHRTFGYVQHRLVYLKLCTSLLWCCKSPASGIAKQDNKHTKTKLLIYCTLVLVRDGRLVQRFRWRTHKPKNILIVQDLILVSFFARSVLSYLDINFWCVYWAEPKSSVYAERIRWPRAKHVQCTHTHTLKTTEYIPLVSRYFPWHSCKSIAVYPISGWVLPIVHSKI